MLLGIDLHGVVDGFPEFKELLRAMKACGNKIFIISGPPADDVIKALDNLGYEADVHYDLIISVVDHLKANGAKMWQDERGRWWTNDDEWWASKAQICKHWGVDILIDDSERYREYFEKLGVDTKFILIKKNP
jgi:hypothetical protein